MPFLTPNSLASLLESALSTHSSITGQAVYAHIIRTLFTPFPSSLSNHLINMYSKLNLPNSAQLVLSLTPNPSVVTWTSPISGATQNGLFSTAPLHFSNMRR
ncbi:hypothetical protein CsSME_00048146 [Camellia sinensis var. sinensis]